MVLPSNYQSGESSKRNSYYFKLKFYCLIDKIYFMIVFEHSRRKWSKILLSHRLSIFPISYGPTVQQVIGTVLAFVNTVALLAVLSNKRDKDGIHPGAEFVVDMNIIVTIYFVIEQVTFHEFQHTHYN